MEVSQNVKLEQEDITCTSMALHLNFKQQLLTMLNKIILVPSGLGISKVCS